MSETKCANVPTVADCRAWADLGDSFTDADIQQILDAEYDEQARVLDVDTDAEGGCVWPPALCRSLLRRVQRECAARALPLGFASDLAAEFGPVQLAAWDAEVARLEATYAGHVIA